LKSEEEENKLEETTEPDSSQELDEFIKSEN